MLKTMIRILITLLMLIPSVDMMAEEHPSHEQCILFDKSSSIKMLRASIEGHISGRHVFDYLLHAKEGQYLNISMFTKHHSNYFNILAPNHPAEPFFNGAIHGNQYKGVAPVTGDYRIRVYLMRNAARRQETAHYRLEIMAEDEQLLPSDAHHLFDAAGNIPCAQFSGQPTKACHVEVLRKKAGRTTVFINKPDGNKRVILFIKGKPSIRNQEQEPIALKVRREKDLYFIRIGEERYEIPEAVMTGG